MSVELYWLRIVFEIVGHFAMLGLLMLAGYALWAGPQLFGVDESWPLVLYFLVPYLGTLLVAYAIFTAVRVCTWILREGVA